jgi:hypothetical protein
MRQFGVRQIDPGGLEAFLQVGEIIRSADLADAEDVRFDRGENFHHAHAFILGLGGGRQRLVGLAGRTGPS